MYGAETRGARQQKEPTESSALFFHSRIPKARLYLLESGRVSLDERLAELHLESILVHALGDLRVIVCIGFRRFEALAPRSICLALAETGSISLPGHHIRRPTLRISLVVAARCLPVWGIPRLRLRPRGRRLVLCGGALVLRLHR